MLGSFTDAEAAKNRSIPRDNIVAHSTTTLQDTGRQGHDVRVEEDGAKSNASRLSSCTQRNMRRLWPAGLTTLIGCGVCVQETHALDLASLPDAHRHRNDGPSNLDGCESGFLLHKSSTATSIL